MRRKDILYTQEQLKKMFHYDRGSGNLFKRWPTTGKLTKAGCVDQSRGGYVFIQIKRKIYRAHLLIWIYLHGDLEEGKMMDHKDGVRDNNTEENLRMVTARENNFNRHGVSGCSLNSRKSRWRACIKIDGKKTYLGSFKKKEDAERAYLKAKSELHKIAA